MAVGKEAPMPSAFTEAAAVRAALETTVAQFTEIFAAIPATTIKRRLRDAVIIAPNGFSSDDEIVIECCDEKTKEASESL